MLRSQRSSRRHRGHAAVSFTSVCQQDGKKEHAFAQRSRKSMPKPRSYVKGASVEGWMSAMTRIAVDKRSSDKRKAGDQSPRKSDGDFKTL